MEDGVLGVDGQRVASHAVTSASKSAGVSATTLPLVFLVTIVSEIATRFGFASRPRVLFTEDLATGRNHLRALHPVAEGCRFDYACVTIQYQSMADGSVLGLVPRYCPAIHSPVR